MRVIGITEVRQDATRVIRQAQASDEPTLVVLRSTPAAYIVGAARYDELIEEVEGVAPRAFRARSGRGRSPGAP